MRRGLLVLLVIFSLVLFSTCKKEEVKSEPILNIFAKDCNLSDTATTRAMRNAGYMILSQLYDSKSPDTANIVIDPEKLDSYIQILGLIYDTKDIPQVDTIRTIYPVSRARTFITLRLADNTSWAKQWAQGNLNTGNPQVNKLIKEYNLVIKLYNDITVEITGEKPINGPALYERFKNIQGVLHGMAYGRTAMSGEIKIKIENDLATVSFYDIGVYCLGKNCHSQYDFTVDSNCNVHFVRRFYF